MLDSTDKHLHQSQKALLYSTCLNSSSPDSVFPNLLPFSPVFPEEQQISLSLSVLESIASCSHLDCQDVPGALRTKQASLSIVRRHSYKYFLSGYALICIILISLKTLYKTSDYQPRGCFQGVPIQGGNVSDQSMLHLEKKLTVAALFSAVYSPSDVC